MKTNEFCVKAIFNGEEYPFENGSEAYVFHTGILNDVHKERGIQGLITYTALVHSCYRADGGHTPLGALADYIAKNWDMVKDQSDGKIVSMFYEHIETEDEK